MAMFNSHVKLPEGIIYIYILYLLYLYIYIGEHQIVCMFHRPPVTPHDVPRDCQIIILGEVIFGQPRLPLWDMLWIWYRIPNTIRSLNQNVKQERDRYL